MLSELLVIVMNQLNYINVFVDLPDVGKSLEDHSFTAFWSPPLKNQSISQLSKWPFDIFGVIAVEENGTAYFGISVEPNYYDGTDRIAVNVNAEIFHYESRGTVTLLDNNPESNPVISPNYLSTEQDQKRAIESVKLARDLMHGTDELIEIYDMTQGEIAPGDDVQSDEEILEWLRNLLKDDYHPGCTCKMVHGKSVSFFHIFFFLLFFFFVFYDDYIGYN